MYEWMVAKLKKVILVISIITIILDQLLKYSVISSISYQEIIYLIPNFLYLTYVKNTGGAWSIFSNNPYLLILIGIICIIGLSCYIYKKKNFKKIETLYMGLIIGGVIGNLIDRIVRSGVIDYIGMIFGNYYFPVFNLADISIVFGASLLMIDSFRGDKDESRSN